MKRRSPPAHDARIDLVAPRVGARLVFERIDPAHDAFRRYEMSIEPTRQLELWGPPRGLELVVVRGRIGQRARVVRTWFPSAMGLVVAWRKLARLRELHGYELRAVVHGSVASTRETATLMA